MPLRNARKPEAPNVALSPALFAYRLDMPDQITEGAVAPCALLSTSVMRPALPLYLNQPRKNE